MKKQRPTILITDYQALADVRYHIRRFVRFSEQAARRAGFEPQQHQLLLTVKGMPEGTQATIKELAERLQLKHQSVVELVNRLVERKLVMRQRDPSDQRRVLVTLTQQGEKALRDISTYTLAELRLTGPALIEAVLVLIEDATLNRETARQVTTLTKEIEEEVEHSLFDEPREKKENDS